MINKKRLIITSIISIMLVSILFLGSTYSIFTIQEIDEDVNVYKTGDLSITYATSSDNIQIENNLPMTLEDADGIKPYRITITNNGNVSYMFDLILTDTTSNASNTIDYKYIMTKVGYLKPKRLISCTNNIIKEDVILLPGESVDIDVRIWIADDVENTEIGKSFYAKLSVDGLAVYNDNTEIDNSMLALRYINTTNGTNYFNNDTYRTYIKTASFVDYIDTSEASVNTDTNEKIMWDMSTSQDESVIAWLEDNGETDAEGNKLYDLYIGCPNMIYTKDLAKFFAGMTSLLNIYFENINTTLTTTMASMFKNCKSLVDLDLRNWDTSNVTNMGYMFSQCSSLISLDLSSFDTSRVIFMQEMFGYCFKLLELDLKNFNTSNVTNMNYMFGECYEIKNINLSNFDTSKVTNMGDMFRNLHNLESLDITHFDTTNVTIMTRMFYCSRANIVVELTIKNSSVNYSSFANQIQQLQLVLNYTIETESLVDEMVTSFNNSNVVKGTLVA